MSVLAIVLRHYFAYTGRAEIEPPRLFDSKGNVIRHRDAVALDEETGGTLDARA
jgi:hypothetical protein